MFPPDNKKKEGTEDASNDLVFPLNFYAAGKDRKQQLFKPLTLIFERRAPEKEEVIEASWTPPPKILKKAPAPDGDYYTSVPKVQDVQMTDSGYVTVHFNQPMLFNKELTDDINSRRSL
jgi:hypothetical protein